MAPREENADPATPSTQRPNSAWSPFRHKTFAVIWTATVISNIGGWMYSAASGWLMTSLNPSPLIVSMVQVATSLPYCLFALPAGALADIVDRRKLLIFGEVVTIVFSSALAALVLLHRVTPLNLLLLTFLIEAGSAVIAPAWQAVVPQLVPKSDLAAAVSANSAGINVSRAVGPALSGAVIGAYGIAAPFWINAVSTLAVVGALVWWRQSSSGDRRLPPERFLNAIRTGLRYARYNGPLSATLIRATAFFVFASAYWALLPLVARRQIAGGPEIYGVLLGAIGAGAVGGAFALPRLKAALNPDWLVAVGTFGTASAMALFGLAHEVFLGLAASLDRWRFVDHGAVQSQYFSAGRVAGMGARARTFDVRNSPFRRFDDWQRDMGTGCDDCWPSTRPLHRRGRRVDSDTANVEMEAANRR